MKKKILFIAPDYYGFNEVVFNGLKQFSNHDVRHINSTAKYQYKNIQERIHNFFLKTFCGKNIKDLKKGKHIKNIILEYNYDILIVNAPYVMNDEVIHLALKKAKFSILLLWDSINKIPEQEKYLKLFDLCLSFDKKDCEKYHLQKITNFYFTEKQNIPNKYEVSYLATYDHRIDDTIKIFNYLEKLNIRVKGKIFTYPSHPIKEHLPDSIEVIHQIIPFSKSYQYYWDSKIILDIAHPNQIGLSFRPFEAIGMNKKLITTNKDIVNYDFYNPNNIFVIDDVQNISIPSSFLEGEYQELSREIKEKYHIKNWIKNILSSYEK